MPAAVELGEQDAAGAGDLEASDFSIEFNMGEEALAGSFMLHVRGGDGAVAVITAVLQRLRLGAIDCSTGGFFAREVAAQSFRAWRDYRDDVVDSE